MRLRCEFSTPVARVDVDDYVRHLVVSIEGFGEDDEWYVVGKLTIDQILWSDIVRMSDTSFILRQVWWVDDYDAATRSSRRGESPEYRVDEASLNDLLRQALAEMLRWQKGEWTQITSGYQNWHRFTRAQFESMHGCWPHVLQPSDAG